MVGVSLCLQPKRTTEHSGVATQFILTALSRRVLGPTLNLWRSMGFTLVICLLTAKTIGQYWQLLQHVKGKIRQITERCWRPTKFVVSLISAFETELPQTRICVCNIYFCQSLWRKIPELGLARPYRRNRRVQQLLRKIMALGHLPIALLRQNFRRLANANPTRRTYYQ